MGIKMSKVVSNMKRGIALLLCAAMLFSMNGMSALATETQGSEMSTEDIGAENTEVESTEEIERTETESTEIEDTEIEDTETVPTEADVTANMLLSYLVFGSSYLETPDQQYVLAGIGDGSYAIESAVLHYQNDTTGIEYSAEVDTIDGDAALFYLDFNNDSFTGSYRVVAIDYVANGVSGTIDMDGTGIDACFGVNQEVTTNPDAELIAEDDLISTDSIVMTDAMGNELSASEFGNALENAAEGTGSDGGVSATGAGNLVIVLDPGHGGSDPGACYSGLRESDLNLKIAAYCKQELDTYAGVTVYMTRSTDETMGADQVASLDERVRRATAKKANVLISFHLNASVNSTANGAFVYYPNSNYNTVIHNSGRDLAAKIQQKLVALGLRNGGTLIWNCQQDTYPDGSLADYLGLIRRSKLAGYPCVLIEHAFLSNGADVATYLNSDAKLKKLGIADATGIAEYYNLQKKGTTPTISSISSPNSTTLEIKWNQCDDISGYELYRSTSKNSGYKNVAVLSGKSKTSYTDTGLTAGKTYYYKVRSYKGSDYSSYSAIQSAYPLEVATIKSVKSNGSGTLTVSWNELSKATGYILYRSTSEASGYTKLAEINSGSTTSYNDTTASKGTKYYYQIQAYNKQNGKTCYASNSTASMGWSIAAAKISGVNSHENGGLLVKWGTVKNAYRYEVYRSTKKSGTYKKIATVSKNTYEDLTVKTNTSYYYKIRTVNRVNKVNGYGSYSSVKTGKQIAQTSVSLIRTTSDTEAKISWKKVSGATGYKVYRSTSKNGKYTVVKTFSKGTTTSYTNKKLKTGKTYYYKVQVLNKVGSYAGCSELSKAVSVKMLGKTEVSHIQTMGNTKLKVVWEKVSGAKGYQVARSTSKNGTYGVVATLTSDATTSYTDKTVKAGKTYYYKVLVKTKNDGNTGYSEAVSGKTAKTTTITETKAVSAASIQLTWNKSTGAKGYVLYRSTDEKKGYSKIATFKSASTLTYTDAAPKANTTYYYKVRSYNVNNGVTGYGDYSKVVSGKSLALPQIKTLTLTNNGSLNVSWKKVSGAESYQIYRKTGTGSYKKIKEVKSVLSYEDKAITPGTKYTYKIQACKKVGDVQGVSGYSKEKAYTIAYTAIMGTSGATVDQMVKYYNASGKVFPAFYASKGVATVKDMAQIVLEEAAAEGVKAEVVWTQICKETGYLQFGGQVKLEQCNFCGLGATDGGAAGADFSSYADPVRIGVRAQVQHLKAYATEASVTLNNACVDPRFLYVKRGMAKYVEWLGIQENPNTERDALGNVVYAVDANGNSYIKSGCGWATDKNYGFDLVNRINLLKSY